MATVKFLLRNKKANKSVTIYYDIHLSATNRLRGSTKSKINPKYWDVDKQKVRNKTEVSSIKDNINNKLAEFRAFISDKLNDYKTYSINQMQYQLKEDIDIFLGKKIIETEEEITFYTFIDKFIEQSKNRVVEKTGRKLSDRTIQDYTRTLNLIKDFEKKKKYPVSFDTINLEFYYAFKSYLEKLEFSVNTIGKFIKIIKVFMNTATEQGYNTNLSFKNKHFIKPTAYSDSIYLNSKELTKIIELDLSKKPLLDNARDLFIIGAFTGLRVSDFNGLTKDNIKTLRGHRIFHLVVKKTGKYLPIPLHPEVEKVLKKNSGNPPKKMLAQDINDALSKIGKEAKIKEIITLNYIKGGKKLTDMKPKYELIKNHTARRSFCTNAYIAGMPTLDIMAISGHSSEKTFLNYIKITADERALKIAENPFFKPKTKLKKVD
ncbi:MAG: site-specific integrase [Flavobacteriaceae bacterium]|nr:site-specific integrase [Flavobacteriaceae bacterium]